MAKVSIIIPSREEVYLKNTVEDLLNKATGDIEILAILDGPTPHELPKEDKRVKYLQVQNPRGMRYCINAGAEISTGKYLMKLDSHCILSEGFDEYFQECNDNDVVVARRNELSPEWVVTDTTPVDYFYMSNPWTSSHGYMRMSRWITRDRQRADYILDETMTFSGSIWFMSKNHFLRIGKMNEKQFGQWSGEPEELACKTWLSGGRVLINKEIVHAHMRKDKIGRPYHISWNDALKGLQESARYWSSDEWPDRIHNFEWLIDKFWPLPSKAHHCNGERYFWEEDWRKDYHV